MRASSPAPAVSRLLRATPSTDDLALLDAAGVFTFTDLAAWTPGALRRQLAQVNARVNRVGDAPPLAVVSAWIGHAQRSISWSQPKPMRRFASVRSLFSRSAA